MCLTLINLKNNVREKKQFSEGYVYDKNIKFV